MLTSNETLVEEVTNEMGIDSSIAESILNKKYYSCAYIEHGLNFLYDDLVHTCCYRRFIKDDGLVMNLSNDKLDPTTVIRRKLEIIFGINSGRINGCTDCPKLKRKRWREDWSFEIKDIVLNHYMGCNLKCKHCGYIKYRNGVRDTSHEKIIESIKILEDFGLIKDGIKIDVGGGEPSINIGINNILDYSLKKNYNIHINSNGSKYNQLFVDGILKNRLNLTLTPDAGRKETYKVVKGRDLFDKVWNNIARYSAATKGNVSVKLILQKDNINDINDFIQLCKTHGIKETIIDIDLNLVDKGVSQSFFKIISEGIKIAELNDFNVRLGSHWPKETLKYIESANYNRRSSKNMKKYCCLCEKEVDSFIPYVAQRQIFISQLNVIGSDVNNFYCPRCKSTDRARHLWLYMNEIGLYKSIDDFKILIFAPEKNLYEKLLLKSKNITVGDINPEFFKCRYPEIERIDVEDIHYADETFDLVIANHVLEHVSNYHKAMGEIYRVLKKRGNAILQTPFSPVIYNNIEDPLINTEELRLKYYGQKDHVRVFGLRFFDDLISSGFTVYRLTHKEILNKYSYEKYGVNPEEDLIFVSKLGHED